MNAAPLQIRLFGPMRVLVRGEPLPRVRTRSVEWLLALLALRCGREVDRSWLAGTLWPESEEGRARQNLRNDLVALRKALGAEAERVQSPRPSTLTLDLQGADVDLVAFLAALETGDEESLARAVEVYSGSLLEGCYEEWVVPEREALSAKHLAALEALAGFCEAREDHDAAVRWLRRAEQADPLRDSTVRRLMAALAAGGDTGSALEVYRTFRSRLQEELSAAPDDATTQLFRKLRARARAVAAEPVPRLSAPDAKRISQSRPPHPLTQLVGRDEEAAAVVERLSRNRLVTLVGAGGVGKTRLAVEVASLLDEELPGGAAWVELAGLTDGAFLASSIAAAFAVREEGSSGPAGLLADVASRVADSRCLLALDNCEHLLDAVAKVADTLLRSCRNLTILATSRQPLGLTGEVAWRVPSLPAPDPGQIPDDGPSAAQFALSYPAVRLFFDRAEEARRGLKLQTAGDVRAVCSICDRLDGIPLAIELAAARVRSLTVEDINSKLDQRFGLLTGGSRAAQPRQQTLRSLIDWSYDLLNESEKALLCRLSVFSGGWTLESAEKVCSGGRIEPHDLIDILASLSDKSLVVVESAGSRSRYRMLETVRQYARDPLLESGEADTWRDRHLAHFLELAEEAEPHLTGPDQQQWLNRLEAEHDNLRAALDWTEPEPGSIRADLGWRLCASLSRFWKVRGHALYGYQRLAQRLNGNRTVDVLILARALNEAGTLAWSIGKIAEARAWLDECLDIRRGIDDRAGVADALQILGSVAITQGEYNEAQSYVEEALAINRKEGRRQAEGSSLNLLGNVVHYMGDYLSAQTHYEQSVAILKELGDQSSIAYGLLNLGNISVEHRDLPAARALYDEARARFLDIGDRNGVALALGNMGSVDHEMGDPVAARELHRKSLTILHELGYRRSMPEALDTLAAIEVELDAPERAARIWGSVERLCDEIGAARPPVVYVRQLSAARAAMGDRAFEVARREGRSMSLEETIQFALTDNDV